jgi:hypothetical protein
MSLFIIIFSGPAAQRGLWPTRSRGFVIAHNDAPQSVGLPWTGDKLVAETSTYTQQTNVHTPVEIRNHYRSRREPVDLRLRPRGHRDRPLKCHKFVNYIILTDRRYSYAAIVLTETDSAV